LAGHLLECSADDLEIKGTDVCVKGASGLKVTLAQVAKASIGAAGYYLLGGLAPGLEATEQVIRNEMTYANGTAVATVEVDIETGATAVLDLVIGHDCGRVINPLIVEGQIVGALVHGLGNSLFERMIFNEDGQPLTTTLADYLLPTMAVVPNIHIIHLESPTSLNPLGVKGVGEAGVIPTAAAIVGAIEDALQPFGITISHAPVSPAEIAAMISARRAVAAA
jgi:aerobic carbon-monoxide dehydrogenase large subunit